MDVPLAPGRARREACLRRAFFISAAWITACAVGSVAGCTATDSRKSGNVQDNDVSSGSPPRVVQLAPGVQVDRQHHTVVVDATVALDTGWLEQAVCSAGTREHESILAVTAPPSAVHAALLLAGFQPGHPGSWRGQARVPPAGGALSLWVRVNGAETPLSAWVHDPVHGAVFPEQAWVFAGSMIRPNTRAMGPGEHYVADMTGSVVGIVTFGDEVIAFEQVISDQADVDAPTWQVRSSAVPPVGTPVQLVIRPREAGPDTLHR